MGGRWPTFIQKTFGGKPKAITVLSQDVIARWYPPPWVAMLQLAALLHRSCWRCCSGSSPGEFSRGNLIVPGRRLGALNGSGGRSRDRFVGTSSSMTIRIACGPPAGVLRRLAGFHDSYLVDSASSHMLVSKIKPCMSKYKQSIR